MARTQSQRQITTVWLSSEVSKDGEPIEKAFYCTKCGSLVASGMGTYTLIHPGSQPYQPYHIVSCDGEVVILKFKTHSKMYGKYHYQSLVRAAQQKTGEKYIDFGTEDITYENCNAKYIFQNNVQTKIPSFE